MKSTIVLTELFLPTKGGTAVWAAEVYKRLGGKEIHVVTAKVQGDAAVDAAHPNSIHRIDMRRRPWLRPESLGIYWNLCRAALGLAFTRSVAAVHAFRALPEGLVGWAVARLRGCPLVVYAHGEELTTWGRGRKYRCMCFVLKRADRVVANSEHTRDTLLAMGVADERIVVIHPGVDTAVFRPGLETADLRRQYGIETDTVLLFSVGRLSRRKGFDHAIRALARLRDGGVEFRYVLGGMGEDRGFLQELVAECGLGDRVHLIGPVSEEDLPRWMCAADVFLMPNREIDGDNEGFGMVFLEAAACGTPSVAGKDGGTASAVIDGVTGLRVDGKSIDAIADGLLAVISDAGMRRELAGHALRRAQESFSWEVVARKTRGLLFG